VPRVHIITPIPGTPFFDNLKREAESFPKILSAIAVAKWFIGPALPARRAASRLLAALREIVYLARHLAPLFQPRCVRPVYARGGVGRQSALSPPYSPPDLSGHRVANRETIKQKIAMNVKDAQREVRSVYLGGFAGQLVSSAVWFLSATLATWSSPAAGIYALVVGGFLIFLLTQLLLRAIGRRASLNAQNPFKQLAMQIAFTLPLNLPLVAAATLHHFNWFYPAFMIALGTHYLPFIFLYGMWQFGGLAAILIGAGLMLGLYAQDTFSLGGWVTAVVLLLFAFIGRGVALRENK
jgi:hypothetical protein